MTRSYTRSIFAAILVLVTLLSALYVPRQMVAGMLTSSLTIGTLETLPSLDPAQSADVFAWEVLTHLYTGLTRQIPGTLRYELALADSHTVSADGLIHTFTIKPDAAFNDRKLITARTFAAAISRSLGGPAKNIIAPYVKAAQATDDRTLSISLTRPLPFVEQLVALPLFFPVDPDYPQRSNGIYRIAQSDSTNQRDGRTLTLVRDPAWRGTPPVSDSIVLRHFDQIADLRAALQSHQIDIAWRGLPPADIDRPTGNGAAIPGLRLTSAPGLQNFYALVSQKTAPFEHALLRQGMLPLVDRDRIITTALHKTAVPLYSLLPPELASTATPRYPAFNIDQALPVLDKAGYSRYREVEAEVTITRGLYGDLYIDADDALVAPFNQNAPFALTEQDVEPHTFLSGLERGTFAISIVGWTPLVPHPAAVLWPLLHSSGQLAQGARYTNPAVDKLLNQADRVNNNQQATLYDQAQALALQDVVAIPLWQNRQLLVAWDNVTGIVIEPNFLLRYDRLAH